MEFKFSWWSSKSADGVQSQFMEHKVYWPKSLHSVQTEVVLGKGYNLQLEGFWRFSATQTSVMKDFEDFRPSQPSIINYFEGFWLSQPSILKGFEAFWFCIIQDRLFFEGFLNLQKKLFFEGFGFFNSKTVRLLNNFRTTPYSMILAWHHQWMGP